MSFHFNIVNKKHRTNFDTGYVQYTEPVNGLFNPDQDYWKWPKYDGENVTFPVTVRIIK